MCTVVTLLNGKRKMTITKQVLDRLKCKCVLVTFPVAHAHWYKGPAIKREQGID